MARIETLDDLLALYAMPTERVRTKKRDHLDDGLRAVLAVSPFVLLATADAEGRCDVSPRGGPPGFVKPLDDRHLAIPDLNGNNLVDSLRNIVANPHAGLLVLVPGEHETVRIDGSARLTTDDDVLDRFGDELRRPTLAIVVETAAVFMHCAKSFRRGRLWDPASWWAGERSLALTARHQQLGAAAETYDEYAAVYEGKIAEGLAADCPV